MTYKKRILLAAVCGLTLSSPVMAKDWAVDYSQSHLGFIGTQGSASFTGGFKKFQVTIDFDPAKPEAGKITATIDMASAFAGSEERDGALPGSDWFDTSKFPQAQFTTVGIKKNACNVITPASQTNISCYQASGMLAIKGVAKPVTLDFYIATEGDHIRAKGDVKLVRTDFNIGQGQWSNEEYVKHAVDVTIDIVAHPAP